METKDKTLRRLQFMDMVQEILAKLHRLWCNSCYDAGDGYTRHAQDGEAEVGCVQKGLTIRIWVERGGDRIYGQVDMRDIFTIDCEQLDDEFDGDCEALVHEMFWKVYEACMKAPDMEW